MKSMEEIIDDVHVIMDKQTFNLCNHILRDLDRWIPYMDFLDISIKKYI